MGIMSGARNAFDHEMLALAASRGTALRTPNWRMHLSRSLSGAIALSEFPAARYAARRYAGYGLNLAAGDLPELADGKGDLVALIQGIGQEKFEACFLRDAAMSDIQRAEECDIAVRDAERLREFVNRAFIQAEFESPAQAPAAKVFSAVAALTRGWRFVRIAVMKSSVR